jgi:predicted DNA repair protein MutK
LPVYRLMEANFLMLQGDLDGAAALLADVARMPHLTAEDREHIAVLDGAITARRAQKPPADRAPG